MKFSIALNVILGLGQLSYWQQHDTLFSVFGAGFNFGLAAAAVVMHVMLVRGWSRPYDHNQLF